MVRGTNVPIAVIDSLIDAAHPDLEGVIAQRFSAVGGHLDTATLAPREAAMAAFAKGWRRE
jgi:hypothetical protein